MCLCPGLLSAGAHPTELRLPPLGVARFRALPAGAVAAAGRQWGAGPRVAGSSAQVLSGQSQAETASRSGAAEHF